MEVALLLAVIAIVVIVLLAVTSTDRGLGAVLLLAVIAALLVWALSDGRLSEP